MSATQEVCRNHDNYLGTLSRKVVIYHFPEAAEDDCQHDIRNVTDMVNTELKLDIHVTHSSRVGKRVDDNPRLLIVCVRSEMERENLLQCASQWRKSPKWREVSIKPSLSPLEREAMRRRSVVVHHFPGVAKDGFETHAIKGVTAMVKSGMKLDINVTDSLLRVWMKEGKKHSLLVITLENEEEKWKLLRCAPQLRSSSKWSEVFITPELDFNEREARRELNQQLQKERKQESHSAQRGRGSHPADSRSVGRGDVLGRAERERQWRMKAKHGVAGDDDAETNASLGLATFFATQRNAVPEGSLNKQTHWTLPSEEEEPDQLSRQKREAAEREQARRHCETAEAQEDLARLAIIRRRRQLEAEKRQLRNQGPHPIAREAAKVSSKSNGAATAQSKSNEAAKDPSRPNEASEAPSKSSKAKVASRLCKAKVQKHGNKS